MFYKNCMTVACCSSILYNTCIDLLTIYNKSLEEELPASLKALDDAFKTVLTVVHQNYVRVFNYCWVEG